MASASRVCLSPSIPCKCPPSQTVFPLRLAHDPTACQQAPGGQGAGSLWLRQTWALAAQTPQAQGGAQVARAGGVGGAPELQVGQGPPRAQAGRERALEDPRSSPALLKHPPHPEQSPCQARELRGAVSEGASAPLRKPLPAKAPSHCCLANAQNLTLEPSLRSQPTRRQLSLPRGAVLDTPHGAEPLRGTSGALGAGTYLLPRGQSSDRWGPPGPRPQKWRRSTETGQGRSGPSSPPTPRPLRASPSPTRRLPASACNHPPGAQRSACSTSEQA